MEKVLRPMVENGSKIHRIIMKNIDFNNPAYQLNSRDISSIRKLNNKQLAQLSFTTSLAYSRNKLSKDIRACLATAVGIIGIYDLIQNTKALGSVTSTVKALKLIGRRYLGWIGVGLMIYDFLECYNAIKK